MTRPNGVRNLNVLKTTRQTLRQNSQRRKHTLVHTKTPTATHREANVHSHTDTKRCRTARLSGKRRVRSQGDTTSHSALWQSHQPTAAGTEGTENRAGLPHSEREPTGLTPPTARLTAGAAPGATRPSEALCRAQSRTRPACVRLESRQVRSRQRHRLHTCQSHNRKLAADVNWKRPKEADGPRAPERAGRNVPEHQ